MNKKTLKKMGAILVLITLFSVLFVFLPTQRVMATPGTIAISPARGFVGNTIRLNGTIDTSNGNFTLRWDNTLNITTGTAVGFNVTASFIVPPTVAALSGRNVTVELIDISTFPNSIATANFTLSTKFDMQVITLPPPRQLQEGNATSIMVNVTGGQANTVYTANITVRNPANQTHSTPASLSNTTTNGSGSIIKTHPTNFPGAHTNYTGKYLVTSNVTIDSKEFFIGLTDKSVYQRNETVLIQATGYRPSEVVTLNIKFGALSEEGGFPKDLTADNGGKVAFSWKPLNATPGNHTVTFTNATMGGTVKVPADTQIFEISGIIFNVLTKNLADKAVGGVAVEAYKSTTPSLVLMSGRSNETGWIRFSLDSGNYTFKAFKELKGKDVQVGVINQSITADMPARAFNFTLQLTSLRIITKDQSGELPFIDLRLSYNYTTRASENETETVSLKTDLSGTAEIENVFTNLSYRLEARRYSFQLPGTPLENKTVATGWNIVTIVVPTYTAFVEVFDAKGEAVSGVKIAAYEWSSGATQPQQTQASDGGKATFSLTFGKYRLRALADSLVLNETTLDLIENNLNFTFYLATFKMDITASVRDYFSRPIANANVTIEHKIREEYVFAHSQLTDADGSTTFISGTGGDSRISVYLGGKLVAVKTQFLSAGQSSVELQVAEYVAILGYSVPAALFALLIFLMVIAVGFLVISKGQLMKAFRKRRKS